jgi:hypothetical protein
MRPLFAGFLVFNLLFTSCAGADMPNRIGKKRAKPAVKTENLPNYNRRMFRFGVNLGLIHTGLAVRPIADLRTLLPDTIYGVSSIWEPGFSMGIESSMRLGERWRLKFSPTLSLAGRVMEFRRPGRVDQFRFESTLAEFPFHFKYQSVRLTNFSAYLIGGMKYTFDLSSKVGSSDGASFPIKLRPHDLQIEAGVGFEFYLPYFKLSTQLKTAWGLMDVHYPDFNLYSRAIEHMQARSIYISFLFE